MDIIIEPGRATYIAATGDWRIVIDRGIFEIQPQVGQLIYESGLNLDNLATLIVAAKADALERGIDWSGEL
jgi:hypothetical protein